MGWVDDFATSPDEIFLQYQAGRYSELNGEVDRDVSAGTTGQAAPIASGGGTIIFNPQCFLGDTIFHLFSDGAPKVILFRDLFAMRDEFIGKDALSFDKHNRTVRGRILDIFENVADSYLKVTFSDGEILNVVKEHRFLCADYEYRQIGSLLGKTVINAGGAAVEVVTIEYVQEKVKVYNASIHEYKNYCVGKSRKRTHNLKPHDGVG